MNYKVNFSKKISTPGEPRLLIINDFTYYK
jgi:hypothetical protein